MSKYLISLLVVIIIVIGGLTYWLTAPKGSINSAPPPATATTTNNIPPAIQATTSTPNTPLTPAAPTQTPTEVFITIQNFQFNPSVLTVKQGAKVTWTNNDGASHTISTDQGSGPASGPLGQGNTYSYTFNIVGTFAYHCSIHPSMHGSVVVAK